MSLCGVGSVYGQAPDPPVCDRTLQVQIAIFGTDAVSTTSCEQVTITHLEAIAGFSFTVSNLTELKAGDFNDMPNIIEIDLQFLNNLQTLPAGMFEDVNSNIGINLTNNPFSKGLPSELIDRLKDRSGWVELDLTAVNDVLPTTLRLSVGETKDLDLEDTFSRASGRIFGSADSYKITVINEAVATATVTQTGSHTLMVTTLQEGQTEIEVAGIRGDQRAMQSFTVTTETPDSLIFRIKVFLEGAQ